MENQLKALKKLLNSLTKDQINKFVGEKIILGIDIRVKNADKLSYSSNMSESFFPWMEEPLISIELYLDIYVTLSKKAITYLVNRHGTKGTHLHFFTVMLSLLILETVSYVIRPHHKITVFIKDEDSDNIIKEYEITSRDKITPSKKALIELKKIYDEAKES